ncbi:MULTISPECIES: polysaccharide deacetylase family protein [unclassified Paenibacillus]|uniref:polysaccharide deacetylase family protein n=1 Tax=unclassified Paenibacillus TaxID=185978 RepID=UPI0009ACDF6B|nr:MULTISPECIES: polysaccharide deacetylase family protein [unclassified Paenibacillus]MBE1443934.1 peptidoglycan/xylan/chitin deacetylase (PgdA/CDA1 family) [Paenibacillus sp. OAS669]
MNGMQKAGLWLLIVVLLWLTPGIFQQAPLTVYKDRVSVIAYHHIDDQTVGDVTIKTELLREQLTDLLQRGYHFISLTQFKEYLAGGPVPPNAVLVTFDDGYQSFYTRAYPILKELNIPAVNFVITKDLEQPLRSLIPSLSKDEIRHMTREMAGIDVQCHTDSLHDRAPNGGALFTTKLTNAQGVVETEQQFEQRIMDDTQLCRKKLGELYNRPIDSFAYPFGIYDARSADLLNRSGIHYAYTTVSGIASRNTDPMQIPRINAGSPFVKANSLNNLIIQRLHGL